VRIGSAWAATSRAGNDYMSMAFNLPGIAGPVRVNAVQDKDAPEGSYKIIPMAAAA